MSGEKGRGLCRCEPQGRSVGMCEPPRRKFRQGEMVECRFPFPWSRWVGGYVVQREWIAKRTGEHLIDCRFGTRRIGGHRRPEDVRRLRPGTPWGFAQNKGKKS